MLLPGNISAYYILYPSIKVPRQELVVQHMLLKVRQGGVTPRHDAKIEPSTMLLLVSFLKAINAALGMDGAAVLSHHVILEEMIAIRI